MPMTRKRRSEELDDSRADPRQPPGLLQQIRNRWQFANLYQFLFLFGDVLKTDEKLGIEDLEADCLKQSSPLLQEIGLALLKFLSSHRGLNLELFDEYGRRQFLAKAPDKNPFGTDETPARFADFDIFTKLRVLHQMTQFIMMNSEKLREKTVEQREADQVIWRIEPYGWDEDERTYFVLDDNRIYRMTDVPPVSQPNPPRKKSKKSRAALRASKRRRVSEQKVDEVHGEEEVEEEVESDLAVMPEDDLGGMRWECIAVSLEQVRHFLASIETSKDGNQKTLHYQLLTHLVPLLEAQEESKKRKQLQREKEVRNLDKMAGAKRSSRLAGKFDQQRAQEQAREEARRRREEEATRKEEEQTRAKMEKERDYRLLSREQRLREREVRRLQHEGQLRQLSEDGGAAAGKVARTSERRRLAAMVRNQHALEELERAEEEWFFDCLCGVHGQVDDGTHSVACDRCNVWQHSQCVGIQEAAAEKEDFHFVCQTCHRTEDTPRLIKIKVNLTRSSGSEKEEMAEKAIVVPGSPSLPCPPARASSMRDQGQGNDSPVPNVTSSAVNPFSSPHPNLSPPDQSPDRRRLYKTMLEVDPDLKLGLAASRHVPAPSETDPETSPSKQARRPMLPLTKTSPSVPPSSPPDLSPVRSNHPAGPGPYDDRSSPLPPSRGGLSPIKQSPPVAHSGSASAPLRGRPGTAILPPVEALSPSTRQQILVPPVKQAELGRFQHGSLAG